MRVAVLGFGHVASATVQSFMKNECHIRSKTRTPIEWVHVATRSPARAIGRVPEGCKVSDNAWAVVNDPQVDVVLELTGDVNQGRQWVLQALSKGKHVITANKALLALHGQEIMQTAARAGCRLLFEGAVAVSIPIVKTLKESAAANRIESLTGILNGTSNFVLTQMSEHGLDFEKALEQAQALGYAEADPRMDINGEDAAHKLCLLASLCFGVPLDFLQVQWQGIESVQRIDLLAAERWAYRIKLIAHTEQFEGGVQSTVQPMLVPQASMLAHVSGAMNGVSLKGDLMGSAFLYGAGAGGRQTASAVLSDLLELANAFPLRHQQGFDNMGFVFRTKATRATQFRSPWLGAHYVRLRAKDPVGVLHQISETLARFAVPVNALWQVTSPEAYDDVCVLTHAIEGEVLAEALSGLMPLALNAQAVVTFPVLGAD